MTLWNGNSREEGGLRQKCSPWGYGDFLKLNNFNSIRGSQNLGEGLFANSLFRVVSKTIRERTRPPITLLPRAARVCLSRYLPQRVCSQAMMGCTSMFCKQEHFSISYLKVNVLQRHVKLPDNLDTSTFKRPQTCKKGNSLSLKSEPTFQRKKNVAYILEAAFVVVVV